MRIIGLDIASTVGWAHGGPGELPHFGSFKLPGMDEANLQRSMAGLYASVRTLALENGIEGAVVEAPPQGIQKRLKSGESVQTSTHTTAVLMMASGAARAGLWSAGVRQFWFPVPQHWRAKILGAGRPDNPKEAARRYCKAVLQLDIANHDAAEAVCLWRYGLRANDKLF